MGRPGGAQLFPSPQLPIQSFQSGCGLVSLLTRVQVSQSLVQRLSTPVSSPASRHRYNPLHVLRPLPSTLAGQQLFRFFPSFPAQVAAIFLQEMKVTQLVGRPSAIYQLQSLGNGPVSITDPMQRVLRSGLPPSIYGLFPRAKVTQHHAQIIPDDLQFLQFYRSREKPSPDPVQFQYLAPQLRFSQYLPAHPPAQAALYTARPPAGLLVAQPQGRQLDG